MHESEQTAERTHASIAPGTGVVPLSEVLDLLAERIALYRVDDLVMLHCNRAWATANGGEPADMIGRGIDSLLTPAECKGLVDQVARLGPATPFLKGNVTAGAGGRWTEWSDLYIEDPGGDQVLAVGRDVTERREAELRLSASEERYRDLALRDELTGLANRRLLHELTSSALSRTRRNGQKLVVSFLDLDGFKEVNDRHGHAAGDAVLVEVGRRLRAAVRHADVIARVGGDEFVVVQECPPDHDPAARLDAVLGQVVDVHGTSIPCSVSMGSIVAGPGDDAVTLIAAADAAMYAVKRTRSVREKR